jgi:hypothetical protein
MDRVPKALAFALTFAFLQPHRPTQKKQSASQRTQTVQQFSANLGGHSLGQKEGQLVTRVWQKWRLSAPQTHLWLIKIWFSPSTFVVKIRQLLCLDR